MKIWIPTIKTGSGSDVFVLRLAAGLRKFGHDPVVEWFDHFYELIPFALMHKKAPVRTDIIHAGSWSAFAFKRSGLPLVVTEHNYYNHPKFVEYKSALQKVYHRTLIGNYVGLSYKASDSLVSVSNHNADAMRQGYSGAIEVIHNWVDTEEFSPTPAGFSRTADRPFRLLCVGNPSRWKGSDLLLSIIEKLPRNSELLCLGGLRSAPKLSEKSGFRILGRRQPSEMADLYRSVDAVLVISRHESFGYVALEAMACGVPVIGFNVSGTSEICAGMNCALLVPDGDIDALNNAINTLSENTGLLKMLSVNARTNAVNNYSESSQVQKYIDLYSRLLNR